MKRPAQVNVEHRVEVLVAHVLERASPHDARVVDQDVDAAVGLKCGVDDGAAARCGRDRIGGDDGLATGRMDLVDHGVRGAGIAAVTGEAAAGIVDDDLRSARGEHQRVFASEPPAGTGDDGDAIVEAQVHVVSRPSRSPLSRHALSNSPNA